RAGEPIATFGSPAPYASPRISPDGKQAVVEIGDANSRTDLWLVDLARGTTDRFTADPANERSPLWSSDSSEIIFQSDRAGVTSIFRKRTSGSEEERLVYKAQGTAALSDGTADGRLILF